MPPKTRGMEMNSYLSSNEKILFTRITLLTGLLEETIKTYEGMKNVDKGFMRCLRSGNTWTMKALEKRREFLTQDAAIDLIKNVSHTELIFTPTDKAKKEFDRVKEMTGTLHMSLEDFEDWYCSVIPFTCGKCTRKDYEKCKQRKFMMKFSCVPVNLKATCTCQYNYLDAGIDLEEIARQRREAESKKNGGANHDAKDKVQQMRKNNSGTEQSRPAS